jgi:cellulose biosynthesis protein BcsQ/response regulator of citrate/malate metabolism
MFYISIIRKRGDKMKIVLATGVPDLDSAIEDRIKGYQFVGSALYKEAVVDVIQRKKPNILILSELLEGVTSMRNLILTIRTRFPEVRIIYILKDENLKEKAFLYHWMIFDVFTGSFSVPQLQETLMNPKEFKDVHHEMDELKHFKKDLNTLDDDEDESDISDMEGINPNNYSKIEPPKYGQSDLYQQIVTYWSVLDQSGKTFSITNTALALAGRKDLKILLIDFNLDNPNVNLYYSFVDPNRNLGAIIDDIENGIDLTSNNFDDYLITHPTYNNLKILPGAILKMKKRDNKFMYQVFEKIMVAAERNNYSTILIDTKAGLDDLTIGILKKSTKILLHLKETPGTLNALYRVFDTEVGPFVEKFIDKKKIIPIINESHPDTQNNFKRAIQGFLELSIGTIIHYSQEVRPSHYKGVPLLSKKSSNDMYNTFLIISNLIHKNIFQLPKEQKPQVSTPTNNKDKNKEKKGLLRNISFKNKK